MNMNTNCKDTCQNEENLNGSLWLVPFERNVGGGGGGRSTYMPVLFK